jgi:hypothetical protein
MKSLRHPRTPPSLYSTLIHSQSTKSTNLTSPLLIGKSKIKKLMNPRKNRIMQPRLEI